MSIFYKHVFPELEQLRFVMRYIEQRCDRPGHAHWEGHFRFTEIESDTVIEEKTIVYESNMNIEWFLSLFLLHKFMEYIP